MRDFLNIKERGKEVNQASLDPNAPKKIIPMGQDLGKRTNPDLKEKKCEAWEQNPRPLGHEGESKDIKENRCEELESNPWRLRQT